VGAIGLRPLPELVAAIRRPANNVAVFPHLREMSGAWQFDGEKRVIRSLDREGGTAVIDLPDAHPDYFFETDVDFDDSVAAVSVTPVVA